MANVKVIPPREKKPDTLRVAAYCRVSSDSSDQLHSYATQIRNYTEKISKHDGWELVDVYADSGLTGTRMDKREEFNRMLADCRKGKIDKILVKSISRFARNTRDCLAVLRELSALGISVQFEKENINTETLTTELMVSVSGALAQEESVSISQNQRMSYKRRMERGEYITCSAPLGYQLVGGKNLEIVEDEAKTIRWIFERYLAGDSAREIACQLTEKRMRAAPGYSVWHESIVYRILGNEKYVGDALCQKTYTTNTFPFSRLRNHGEADQYYIENTHPAIIDRETFERTQALLEKRTGQSSAVKKEYPLSRKLICGICGGVFTRKVSNTGHIAWSCRRHLRRSADCPMGRISQHDIYTAFIRLYQKLKRHEDSVLKPALAQLEDLNSALQRGNPVMLAVNQAIAEASDQSHKITILQSKGLLDADACTAKLREIDAKLLQLRRERRRLLKNEDTDYIMDDLRRTMSVIHDGPEQLEQFDEALFSSLVERITAESNTCLRFRLHGGIELAEVLL